MNTVVFKIGGMVCDGCAANVERTLADIPEIARCTVSYTHEQATVHYSSRQLDVATIQQAITEAGFTAQRL